jgi:hypothetical protein
LSNYKSLENDNPNNINNIPKDEQFDYTYYDRKNTEDLYNLADGFVKIFYHGIKYWQNQDRAQQIREEIDKRQKQLLKEYEEIYKNFHY